jgi:uncharacterized protein (DUF983 family)
MTRQAYCPKCHNYVYFQTVGMVNRCPVCGFEYQLTDARSDLAASGGVGDLIVKIFGGLLIGVLALAGIVALILGIAFVGCMIKGGF